MLILCWLCREWEGWGRSLQSTRLMVLSGHWQHAFWTRYALHLSAQDLARCLRSFIWYLYHCKHWWPCIFKDILMKYNPSIFSSDWPILKFCFTLQSISKAKFDDLLRKQVAGWFIGTFNSSAESGLKCCKIKNKFALSKEALVACPKALPLTRIPQMSMLPCLLFGATLGKCGTCCVLLHNARIFLLQLPSNQQHLRFSPLKFLAKKT